MYEMRTQSSLLLLTFRDISLRLPISCRARLRNGGLQELVVNRGCEEGTREFQDSVA